MTTRSTALTALRTRFKALWADIHHVSINHCSERERQDVLAEVKGISDDLGKLIDTYSPKTFAKATDDPCLDKLLAGVVGVVEADSYAQHMLWQQYAEEAEKYGSPERNRYSWVQGTSGLGRNVGQIDGNPVFVSLYVNIVHGQRLLFVDATSNVVDHGMIEKWLLANLPETALREGGKYINRTDPTNFCNILDRVKKAA